MVSIPTEVVVIDDHKDFLFGIEDCLNGKRHNFHLFSDTTKALKFINSKTCNLHFLKNINRSQELESYHEVTASFDYKCLHQEIFQKDRFDNISVIVVDYSMPEMNGLELLNGITDRNIKRILLTGEADEKIAVRAFNDGLIHQYIRKDSSYPEKLAAAIEHLTMAYWSDLTKPLQQVLSNHFPAMPLEDPKFISYFRELIEKHGIVEYYLLDGTFRFLMIDERGERFTLWVQTEAEAKSYAFEFQHYDEADIALGIREDVNEYRKILCPPLKKGIWPHRSEWWRYLRNAKNIGEKFFAAFAEGYDIDEEYMPFLIKKKHHILQQY